MGRRLALAALAALALATCSTGGDGGPGVAAPAATTSAGVTTTTGAPPAPAAPTATTTTAPTTTTSPVPLGAGAAATATCPAVPPLRAPDPGRPTYLLDVTVLPGLEVVEGRVVVRFTPDLPTDRLVFRLWPNGPRPAAAGAALEAGPVFLGSSAPAATSAPDPTTLEVLLPDGLAAGQGIEATIPFRLRMPGASNDRLAHEGDALRLGSFFPILAWEPGVGWAREAPTALFAEASMAPVADFSIAVTVPDGYAVLGSGTPDRGRLVATAVRDVALSVGRFRTAEATVAAPAPVRVTVGVVEGVDEDPAAYLERVVAAMEDFASRYGPYPAATFTFAITPGLRGGIEYPGHVMQGPGTIGRTTPHEVGDQWFYGLVGNDQGRDPVLDEGLATWAEARVEGNLPSILARALPERLRSRAGEAMAFWESEGGNYYRGVYGGGAEALAALGDPDLVDCGLRRFVADNAFSIATQDDLVAAMSTVFPDAAEVLAGYGIGG